MMIAESRVDTNQVEGQSIHHRHRMEDCARPRLRTKAEDSSQRDCATSSPHLLDLATANRLSSVDVSADSDPISTYMARLHNVEPLPAEDQQLLARRYVEDGDMNAAKLLVLTNLRLVVKLAKEYKRRWVDMLDLVQEGNVGLAEAVTRYDPYRGVKFTSYAQYWVRAMILNYLMDFVHPVRIGGSRAGRKLFYNLKKARRELSRRGINPTSERVADFLEVDESEVVRVGIQLDAPPVALDAPAPGYNGTTIGQLMPGDFVGPEEAVARYEIAGQIDDAIARFGESLECQRSKAIWYERMIVDDAKTLKELGQDWDVSKERIRQIEVEIRNAFKHYLLEYLGDDVELSWLEA